MTMPDVDINYLAVLIAAMASMVVGSIWYAEPVLGKKWMALMGKKKEDIKKDEAMKAIGLSFVLSFVMSYVLAHIIDYAEATTWSEGAVTGFWVWLGFVATAMITNALFEGKKMALVWIFLGNSLLTLLAMGIILAVWV